MVDAYLAASRSGDMAALLAVLDPDVVLRADRAAAPQGQPLEVRGAKTVSRYALAGGRGRVAQLVVVDGAIGIVAAPQGRPTVLRFAVVDGRIAAIDVFATTERLMALDLSVLD